GPADLAACLRIRRIVFIEEQRVPEADDLDGLDGVCRHFLALPEPASPPGAALGTARLLLPGDGTAKAQRLALLGDHRRRGIGRALMQAVEAEARSAGASVLVLASQLPAMPLYQELGYAAYGDVFLDSGIEHRMMRKALPAAAHRE